MIAQRVEKAGGIGTTTSDDRWQFPKLLAPDCAGQLKWPQVVTRKDKTERFLEGIIAFRSDQMVVPWQVARPAVGAKGQEDVVKFLIVRNDDPAFHRRDMV
jgi:hypothetical protein